MQAFVNNLLQDFWGRVLVGVILAVAFSAIFWHFFAVSHGTKIIFGLALLAGGYKFYKLEVPA